MRQQRFCAFCTFFLLFLMAACGPAVATEGGAEVANSDRAGTTMQDIFGRDAEGEAAMDVADIVEEATAVTPPNIPDIANSGNSSYTTNASDIPTGFTSDGRPYLGSLDAPIVLEEFSDFQCPFCSRFANETLPSLLANQIANGEVLLVYYDFPIQNIHPQATAAANAARCAGEQGAAAYWQMHDLLFADIAEWSNAAANERFASYGQTLGLDKSFVACLDAGKYVAAVEADLALGQARGVSSTPSFFLNGQLLVGAQPYEVFTEALAIVAEGGQLNTGQETAVNNQPPARPTPAPLDYSAIAIGYGDENAPVRIVEFTDYQCPYCQRHATQTMPLLWSEMIETGRVYYMIKDLPLESIHPEARIAANAARCAGEQKAYEQMHDYLFAAQSLWGGQGETAARAVFLEMAAELELDTAEFDQCLAEWRYDDLVQANMNEAARFGVGGTPFFFVDGLPVNGARPYEQFDVIIALAEAGTLADAYQQQQPQQQAAPTPAPVEGVLIDGNFSIGDPDAPVMIVEFTDFQCPYCARHFAQTLPSLIEKYVETGVVRYVFKDMPLTQLHPQAMTAAEAARCAWEQEAYMPMHDTLFINQGEWNGRNDAATIFTNYAQQLGLDTAVFSECLSSHKYREAVTADLQYGSSLGIGGTPTFVINGQLVFGAQPLAVFEEIIAGLLGN